MVKNLLKLSNIEHQLSGKILEVEDFALNVISLESFMYEIIEQIDATVIAILLVKGIIHPDILTNEQFLSAYTKLIKERNMYNALKPVERHVQLIYDISNIKINLRETKIVYIIDK